MARAGRVWPILGVLLATPVGAQVPRIHRQIYPSPAAPVSIAGLADGATLAMILEAIAAKVSGDGKTVSVRLPVSVTIMPFAPRG